MAEQTTEYVPVSFEEHERRMREYHEKPGAGCDLFKAYGKCYHSLND